jgi:hypothetical protein
MRSKRKIVKWFLLLFLLLLLAYLWIEIETDLPYPKLTDEPIKVDWKVSVISIVTNNSLFTVPESGRVTSISMLFDMGYRPINQ